MDASGSRIKSAIEDIRMLINLSSMNAKYDDAYLARTVIPRAINDVYSRAILTSDNPAYVRMSITVNSTTEYVQLPVSVQSIIGIRKYSTEGHLLAELRPEGIMNPFGPGWSIEGNMLHFFPIPQQEETWELWYIPSADIPIQYGTTATASTTTDVTSMILPTTPTLGLPFKFENEPLGHIIRILGSGTWYERIITSYDATSRTVGWRNGLGTIPATTNITYEVIPSGSGPMWFAAAARAAMELGVSLDISQSRRQALKETALSALKTLRDQLSNMQGRVGKGWDKKTIDNAELAQCLWTWKN